MTAPMMILMPDDCPHFSKCRAKRDGDHSETCPTRVLALSDDDVLEWISKHAYTEWTGYAHIMHGWLDDAHASTSGTAMADWRWLAENLIDYVRCRDAVLGS